MTELQPVLKIGDVLKGLIGDYRVVAEPENGGYAQVYRVEAKNDGKAHMLKLNSDPSCDEFGILERVASACKTARLPQSTALRVDKLTEAPKGWVGHVEELAQGQTCAKQKPSEQQALQIALAFGKVLRACAVTGIAYKDVKPGKHVFWRAEQSVIGITVIDWNVATTSATFADLRYDLVRFCETLPEFFTGKPQENSTALHALAWPLPRNSQERPLGLSYATWQLLADLSLSPGGLLPYEIRDLMRLPTQREMRDREKPVVFTKIVVEAWDSILGRLENALRIAQVRDPEAISSSNSTDSARAEEAAARLAAANARSSEDLKETAEAEWLRLLGEAEMRAKNCWLAVKGGALRTGAYEEYERPLRAARLLQPQNPWFALAWSAYVMWDRLGTNDEFWKKLIGDLFAERAEAIRSYLLVERDGIRANIEATCQQRESGKDKGLLSSIWVETFGRLVREIWVWTALAIARRSGDVGKALELVNQAKQEVPEHPLAAEIEQQIKEHQRAQAQLRALEEQLLGAIKVADADAATSALSQLKVLVKEPRAQELITAHAVEVEHLQQRREARTTVDKALASWNVNLILGAFPATDRLGNAEEADAKKRALNARQKEVETLETRLREIKRLLPTIDSDEPAKLDARLPQLREAWKQLGACQTEFKDAPQVREVLAWWLEHANTLVESLSRLAKVDLLKGDGCVADVDLANADTLLFSLRNLRGFLDSIQMDGVSQKRDELAANIVALEARQGAIKSRQADLGTRFRNDLGTVKEAGDLINLYARWKALPSSVQKGLGEVFPRDAQANWIAWIHAARKAGNHDEASLLVASAKMTDDDETFQQRLGEEQTQIGRERDEKQRQVQQLQENERRQKQLAQWRLDAQTVVAALPKSDVVLRAKALLGQEISKDPGVMREREQLEQVIREPELSQTTQQILVKVSQLGTALDGVVASQSQTQKDLAAVSQQVGAAAQDLTVAKAQHEALIKQIAEIEDRTASAESAAAKRNRLYVGLAATLLGLILISIVGALLMGRHLVGLLSANAGKGGMGTPPAEVIVTEAASPSTTDVIAESASHPTETQVPTVLAVAATTVPSPTSLPMPTSPPATDTPTPTPDPWAIGASVKVTQPDAIVYSDSDKSKKAWHFAFRSTWRDFDNQQITPTGNIVEVRSDIIKIQVVFVVYEVNLDKTGDSAFPLKFSGTRTLRSLSQRYNESQNLPNIQAYLGVVDDPPMQIGKEMVLSGPKVDTKVGNFYEIRLSGWIERSAVEPIKTE